jgi:hypothetical protein
MIDILDLLRIPETEGGPQVIALIELGGIAIIASALVAILGFRGRAAIGLGLLVLIGGAFWIGLWCVPRSL